MDGNGGMGYGYTFMWGVKASMSDRSSNDGRKSVDEIFIHFDAMSIYYVSGTFSTSRTLRELQGLKRGDKDALVCTSLTACATMY